MTIKSAIFSFSAAVLILLTACQQEESQANAKEGKALNMEDQATQLGYTIGAQIAAGLQQQQMDKEINVEGLKAALDDVLGGKTPRMTQEQMQQAQLAFQQAKMAEEQAKADTNQKTGDEYLAANAKKEGVTTTDSGLQYEVLREGKGAQPAATDTVKVHYTGTLIDGTKFDSSYDRGAPADFPVGGVIPGFAEGLQLMKEGAKYKFTIPAAQAYGQSAPPSIGPNQVLVFEVEMIEVLTQADKKPE